MEGNVTKPLDTRIEAPYILDIGNNQANEAPMLKVVVTYAPDKNEVKNFVTQEFKFFVGGFSNEAKRATVRKIIDSMMIDNKVDDVPGVGLALSPDVKILFVGAAFED